MNLHARRGEPGEVWRAFAAAHERPMPAYGSFPTMRQPHEEWWVFECEGQLVAWGKLTLTPCPVDPLGGDLSGWHGLGVWPAFERQRVRAAVRAFLAARAFGDSRVTAMRTIVPEVTGHHARRVEAENAAERSAWRRDETYQSGVGYVYILTRERWGAAQRGELSDGTMGLHSVSA